MPVRSMGCKLLVLGAVMGIAPAAIHQAQAARPHGATPAHAAEHAASGHAATAHVSAAHASTAPGASLRTVVASHAVASHAFASQASAGGSGRVKAMANAAHFGGGDKAGSARGLVRTAMFTSKRFSFKGGKMRVFAGNYTGGYAGSESSGGAVIQCVTFARAASGVELSGNAADWWDNAAGRYARGHQPEPGSVLNFRSTGGMRLGHVAVVSNVISSREIEIDHAHWGGPGSNGGGIARGMSVVDVSPSNDWSQVKVSLGGSGYGSTYPTYGFIYDRPDNGVIMAAARATRRGPAVAEEVAEAPVRVRSVVARRGMGEVYDRNSQ